MGDIENVCFFDKGKLIDTYVPTKTNRLKIRQKCVCKHGCKGTYTRTRLNFLAYNLCLSLEYKKHDPDMLRYFSAWFFNTRNQGRI